MHETEVVSFYSLESNAHLISGSDLFFRKRRLALFTSLSTSLLILVTGAVDVL